MLAAKSNAESGQTQGGDDAEMQPWRGDSLLAERADDAEVVVLIGVPKIDDFLAEKSQPGEGKLVNVGAGLVRPIGGDGGRGNVGATAEGFFGDADGVGKHLGLIGAKARWILR